VHEGRQRGTHRRKIEQLPFNQRDLVRRQFPHIGAAVRPVKAPDLRFKKSAAAASSPLSSSVRCAPAPPRAGDRPTPLGLHILMGTSATQKVAKMIDNLERGLIAPTEIISRTNLVSRLRKNSVRPPQATHLYAPCALQPGADHDHEARTGCVGNFWSTSDWISVFDYWL
jgi:hypothetical protein